MSRSLVASGLVLFAAVVSGAAPQPVATGAADNLARGQKFAEKGRADLFVAATAAWDLKADDERLWVPAVDFGRRVIAKAEVSGDRAPHNSPSSFPDFATYKRLCDPRFTRMDVVYLRPDPQKGNPPVLFPYNEAILARGVVDPAGLSNCTIVSRGDVQTETGIQTSVVFANGGVTARTCMNSVVIVCDGDVNLIDSFITQGVIVARGNITARRGADSSVLVAGGKVTLHDQEKRLATGKRRNVIKENETNPFGYITFFELSTVGVEVKLADKAMVVAKVAEGKAFATAGVRAGDVVTEVNGKTPDSAESLRRLLRDALAIGDATLILRRGDTTATVKVALPE